MLITALIILILCIVAFLMLKTEKIHKQTNEPIIAAHIDIEDYVDENSDFETVSSNIIRDCKKNGINTVIFTLKVDKEVENLSELDTIKKLKKTFRKSEIQSYALLDCTNLSENEILTFTSQVKKSKIVVGIILDNFGYSNDFLQEVKKQMNKGVHKPEVILQIDDSEQIKSFANDTYICENLDSNQYIQLKKSGIKEKILLNYTTPSIGSDIFTLSNFYQFDGAVVTDNIKDENLLISNMAFNNKEELPKFNLSVKEEFEITYPTKDIVSYNKGVLITGTGVKDGFVNINGQNYETAPDGSFGIYFELEKGENRYTIKRNGQEKSVTVTKKVYEYTGSSTKPKAPWDEQYKLEYGRMIKTISPLTSVLSNPNDESSIICGLGPNTVLKVKDSVKIKRNGFDTYAYQLENGGYVVSHKVEVIPRISEDYDKTAEQSLELDISKAEVILDPKILSADISECENGDEIINLEITRNTAVFTEFSNDELKLLLLDAKIENIVLPQSKFATSYEIENTEEGAYITINLNKENPLWGYDVNYIDGMLQIYLKNAPHISNSDKPLENVTIMIDPGHGGKDNGALGVGGLEGPTEKEINLAVAQATKTLLEQYGANVIMTRDNDEFYTLDERRDLARDKKPDLFIAIHHNSLDYSFDSTKTNGSEAYYFTTQSEKFAQLLCENITNATNRKNRGAHNGYYYVTRNDICPSVLMEYSFIINANEFSNTYSDIDIYKAAWGTLSAVMKVIPE